MLTRWLTWSSESPAEVVETTWVKRLNPSIHAEPVAKASLEV